MIRKRASTQLHSIIVPHLPYSNALPTLSGIFFETWLGTIFLPDVQCCNWPGGRTGVHFQDGMDWWLSSEGITMVIPTPPLQHFPRHLEGAIFFLTCCAACTFAFYYVMICTKAKTTLCRIGKGCLCCCGGTGGGGDIQRFFININEVSKLST